MAEALSKDSLSDLSDEDQSPLDITFNKASDHVRKITSKLNNDQLLEIYGLFKQGTEGECNIPKPSWFDGRGRKKWEAWRALGDMPSDEAKRQYIELVKKYDPEFESEGVSDSNSSANQGPKEAWVAVSSLRHSPEPELIYNQLSLLEAARENLAELVKELLAKHPELKNEKDEDGLTAVHWAADRDATAALKAVLDGGCDVNAVDNNRQTALHYAVSCGHIKSTKILLDAGALLLEDEDGCTPVELATDEDIQKILGSVLNK